MTQTPQIENKSFSKQIEADVDLRDSILSLLFLSIFEILI